MAAATPQLPRRIDTADLGSKAMSALSDASTTVRVMGFVLSNGITLPYYRFYRQNTMLPMMSIGRRLREKEQPDAISRRLQHWRDKKSSEFQFIQVASTLLAAAVIGCFSWGPRETELWLGPAAWYASLVLSLSALFLSSSLAFVFSTIKDSPTKPPLSKQLAMVVHLPRPFYWTEEEDGQGNFDYYYPHHSANAGAAGSAVATAHNRQGFTDAGAAGSAVATAHSRQGFTAAGTSSAAAGGDNLGNQQLKDDQGNNATAPPTPIYAQDRDVRVRLRWKMVFTWQAPMMLMAYSVVGFIMGFVIYVCTPLYDGRDFDDDSKAAILVLAFTAIAGAVFVICSHWTYSFVDLDGDTGL